MILKWGKHKGCAISNPAVPLGYLSWLLAEANLSYPERRAVLQEIDRRLAWYRVQYGMFTQTASHSSSGNQKVLPEVVQQWHRKMQLRFHPDRGGSHEAGVVVNVAYDLLRELLSQS
jgi:hypothetical protein